MSGQHHKNESYTKIMSNAVAIETALFPRDYFDESEILETDTTMKGNSLFD